MTAEQTPPQQPRGAGSGDKANAVRGRNIVDWPPEPKSHDDAVDELEAEAEAQADFNAELNNIQTQQIAEMKDKIGFPQGDPENADKIREEAKEAFLAANDPKKKEAALKGEMKARAEREKAAAQK